MQHKFRITCGYRGKAKSCMEAWVPTVSIHRPLSVKKFLQVKKKHRSLYKKRGNERNCARERGRREGKRNPRERGTGKGEGSNKQHLWMTWLRRKTKKWLGKKHDQKIIVGFFKSVLQICISLNVDPDPGYYLYADPDPESKNYNRLIIFINVQFF